MPSSAPENCQHIQLADSHIGCVTICPDCGVVHLALNHITVRLTPDAFRALAGMTGQAQARLDHVASASAAAVAVIDAVRVGTGNGTGNGTGSGQRSDPSSDATWH